MVYYNGLLAAENDFKVIPFQILKFYETLNSYNFETLNT